MNSYEVTFILKDHITATVDADDAEIAADTALELLLLHFYDNPREFEVNIKETQVDYLGKAEE